MDDSKQKSNDVIDLVGESDDINDEGTSFARVNIFYVQNVNPFTSDESSLHTVYLYYILKIVSCNFF